MLTVKDILNKKGHDYWYVSPENTILEALQLMAIKNIGALMVLENGKLVGMFSERDFARKAINQDFCIKDTKVADLMTTEIVVVSPETTVNECMALMTQKKVRHLPVIDKNKISGMISIGDVVNAIIHQQNITIKNLQDYILGSGYGSEF